MSLAKISKEDVSRVRKQLKADGIKPTIENIRVGLGNIGSVTTIQQFKNELEEEERAAKDSPEALQAFREFWSLAVQEGRAQREEEVLDIKETSRMLAADVARAESEAGALRLQADGSTKKLEETIARLNGAIEDLAKARTASEHYAAKLVDVGEIHTEEIKKLREQAEKDHDQHRQECGGLRQQLASIDTEHRLKVEMLRAQAEKAIEMYREEVKELRGHAEKANVQHRGELGELRARLDAEKELVSDLRVKLARAEALALSRDHDMTPEEPAGALVPNGCHSSSTS